MAKNNDAVIKELMKKVEDQKAALGTRAKVAWSTNGVFKKDSSNFFNINTVKDVSVLVAALGFLISQEEAYGTASVRLAVNAPDFKWGGYSVKDWTDDFKTRIRLIEWDKKKKTLDDTKKKLAALISELESIRNFKYR